MYVEKLDRTTFPELGVVAADAHGGRVRPVALTTLIEHPDRTVLGRRVVVRPEGESTHVDG